MLPQSHTGPRFSDARQSEFLRQLYDHEERTLVTQPPSPKPAAHLASNFYSWNAQHFESRPDRRTGAQSLGQKHVPSGTALQRRHAGPGSDGLEHPLLFPKGPGNPSMSLFPRFTFDTSCSALSSVEIGLHASGHGPARTAPPGAPQPHITRGVDRVPLYKWRDKGVKLDEMTASIQPFEKREEYALHVERDVAQLRARQAKMRADREALGRKLLELDPKGEHPPDGPWAGR